MICNGFLVKTALGTTVQPFSQSLFTCDQRHNWLFFVFSHFEVAMASQPFRLILSVSPENIASFV